MMEEKKRQEQIDFENNKITNWSKNNFNYNPIKLSHLKTVFKIILNYRNFQNQILNFNFAFL